MIIREIALKNYRNYRELSFFPEPGVNILTGKNAQGKTNLLEAVFFCSTGKSHRRAKDPELIGFGTEEGDIRLRLEKEEIPHSIDVHLKKGAEKGIAVDGAPIRRVIDLFGTLRTVFFAPEDLAIIKSGPLERRTFMDVELCQIDRIYTHELIRYNRAVLQKNKLLKQLTEHPELAETLPVWNEQLAAHGCPVIRTRERFLEEISVLVREIHAGITGGTEEIALVYEPSRSAETFEQTLAENQWKERAAGMALYGPHRDDIRIEVNGIDVRHFGSQGQQRTAALSLKLAEIELIRKKTGTAPVLLLDDVLSELDEDRQKKLLAGIDGVQTFLTCTGAGSLPAQLAARGRVFEIENGTMKENSR